MAEMVLRGIARTWRPQRQTISPIHAAAAVLEPGSFTAHDPFLVLMEDWFQRGAFGEHPHRGQETVTYVIEGVLEHYDSHTGRGELHPGDVQWMTAGRGVIHVEQPAEGSLVHSLQLWINLPQRDKMTAPGYQNLRRQEMPVRRAEGVEVRVFSGSSGETAAPTQNHVPVTMVEMSLEAGRDVLQDLPGSYRGLLYVLAGKGRFGSEGTAGEAGEALWLGDAEMGRPSGITVRAESPLRVLLIAGEPLHEPVAAGGPFVMNTREELHQAYLDYQSGHFGE